MKVYIYKPKNTEFQDDWLFAAYMGFTQLGAEIIYFEDYKLIPYAPDNIVVSYIEDTIAYFKLHSINYPEPLNIPVELRYQAFLEREVKQIKFKHAKRYTDPFFIKPAKELKSFSAGVVNNGLKLNYLIEVDDEEEVLVSDIINMESEYRCFVHNNIVADLKHYSGNRFLFPDVRKIQHMVDAYKVSAPIAYTLDVAISNKIIGKNNITGKPIYGNNTTLIIECNDMWSVGHYGLNPKIYAIMLRDRWFQLTGYRTF